MSATTPADDSVDELDPDRVFERYIWTNPGVCTNCFARIKNDDATRRRDAGVPGYDADDLGSDPYGTITKYEFRTTCADCGSVGARAPDEDLTRREMLDRVPALVARLQEQAILVDRREVRECVRACKSRDEIQGYDKEIFERAVAFSLRRRQLVQP